MNNLCPLCNGEAVTLGTLGNLVHMRCRDCGMDFNSESIGQTTISEFIGPSDE